MPTLADEAACGECVFFDGGANQCHRYPPAGGGATFPPVKPEDWCGEFVSADTDVDEGKDVMASTATVVVERVGRAIRELGADEVTRRMERLLG